MSNRQSRRGRFGRAVPIAVGALLVIPSATKAQDALGGGRALDGNLGANTGGINRTGPIEDFRSRNLVVTGDVPAGRGFRGIVGYQAAGDFMGATGSDDLFVNRAYSALSAPSFISLGHTAGQMRFGEDLAVLEYRRASSPSGAVEAARTSAFRRVGLLADRIRLDWLAQATNSDEVLRESVTPRIIGVQRSSDGVPEFIVDASSLLGVTQTPVDAVGPLGLSVLDRLRLREDEEEGRETLPPGGQFKLDFEALPPELLEANPIAEPSDPQQDPHRLAIGQSEDYQRIVERIAERYFEAKDVTWSAEPTLLKDLQTEFERLQEELEGQLVPLEPTEIDEHLTDEGDEGDEGGAEPDPPGLRTGPEPLFPIPGVDPGFTVDGSDPEPRELADFGIVLRHGEQIDRLASNDLGRFSELLAMAEESLRKGEYFWAERRFIRALRFVPGHPLATAGLGHAQLGAGLYASAALTLRALLTLQPEMIDARYAESLLPNRVRLGRAMDELRERVTEGRDLAADGFLLAYLGHHLPDETVVREGLEAMQKGDPDDPLPRLLGTVWIVD